MCEEMEDVPVGAVIISFEDPLEQEDERRAMIRTKKGTERFYIPARFSASQREMLKYIKQEYPGTHL